MGVRQSVFGRMEDGVQVDRFELEGEGGLRLAVLTYGATIQSLIYREKDVVLGYDRLEVGEIYDFNEGSRRCFTAQGFAACEATPRGHRYRLVLRGEDTHV